MGGSGGCSGGGCESALRTTGEAKTPTIGDMFLTRRLRPRFAADRANVSDGEGRGETLHMAKK